MKTGTLGYILFKLGEFSLLIKSKILDSCSPPSRGQVYPCESRGRNDGYRPTNENVIPVPARCSASARKREDGNPEGLS